MAEANPRTNGALRIGLPKGRMHDQVIALLTDAGFRLSGSERSYRPALSLPGSEVKLLKPQNIVEMLHAGSRDIGFAGADWVAEKQAQLVELLDTGLDPVRIVAAAPVNLLVDERLPAMRLRVASEYERLTRAWIEERQLDAEFVRSFGATEVFPPEDADVIVDNCATGSTLRANQLQIVGELMRSSTRLYANPRALDDAVKQHEIDNLVLVIGAVLQARHRVMLEINVSADHLEAVLEVVPCLRDATVAQLAHGAGFAVKAAVPRADLPTVIPLVKARGGTDIIVTRPAQIVR